MIHIIIYIVFAIVTQFFTYKFIKKVDKKERKKLKEWEKEYIIEYAEIWKDAHFDQLAIQKKIQEYEKKKKLEEKQTKEALKNIKIDDDFEEIYNAELEYAIDKLENKEEL